MKTRSEAISLLEQCHSFPCIYMFKVIGENTSAFYGAVLAEVSTELGGMMGQKANLTSRLSSGGKYLSVTLRLEMESAEQVLKLYERFSKVKGLRSLM